LEQRMISHFIKSSWRCAKFSLGQSQWRCHGSFTGNKWGDISAKTTVLHVSRKREYISFMATKWIGVVSHALENGWNLSWGHSSRFIPSRAASCGMLWLLACVRLRPSSQRACAQATSHRGRLLVPWPVAGGRPAGSPVARGRRSVSSISRWCGTGERDRWYGWLSSSFFDSFYPLILFDL
jgi:hypothetical protein